MIYVVDTNVMLRHLLKDDERQSPIATAYLTNPNYRCVLPTSMICEVIWVLTRTFKARQSEIITMIEGFIETPFYDLNLPEIEMGLKFLKNNGDFADGIIAHQVSQYLGSKLLTFDKDAKKIARKLKLNTKDL